MGAQRVTIEVAAARIPNPLQPNRYHCVQCIKLSLFCVCSFTACAPPAPGSVTTTNICTYIHMPTYIQTHASGLAGPLHAADASRRVRIPDTRGQPRPGGSVPAPEGTRPACDICVCVQVCSFCEYVNACMLCVYLPWLASCLPRAQEGIAVRWGCDVAPYSQPASQTDRLTQAHTHMYTRVIYIYTYTHAGVSVRSGPVLPAHRGENESFNEGRGEACLPILVGGIDVCVCVFA